MKQQKYTPDQIEHALVVLEYNRGDVAKAARYLDIPAVLLQRWKQKAEQPEPIRVAGAMRPTPDAALLDEDADPLFLPAPELWDWIQQTFLDDGAILHNEEHEHLQTARIGMLWTNVGYKRGGLVVTGQAEIPRCQGNLWLKTRVECQLKEWFGDLPDFLITIHAPLSARMPDARFCALIEHELYHCGQREDAFGAPSFNPFTGQPNYFLRGHDVEEFVGVVKRYGPGASSANVSRLVQAAIQALERPDVALADIEMACGTCGKSVR